MLYNASIDNPVQQRASLQAVLPLTLSSAFSAVTRGCPKERPSVLCFGTDSLFYKRPEKLQTTNEEEANEMSVYWIYSRMSLSFMAVRAVRHLRTFQLILAFFSQAFNRKLVVRHMISLWALHKWDWTTQW